MIFGAAFVVMGYAVFYWGLHHMPWYKTSRYSLWCLLGIGSITKAFQLSAENIAASPGIPDNATQPQNPNNTQTPNNLVGKGFTSPLSSGLTWGRTDQGVDFGGSGPLYAIGSGTIINLYNTGWPGGTFIVLKLDNPQGLPSPDIYYAEQIVPTVHVGQHVNAGDVIGNATGKGGGIELGYADPKAIGRALGWPYGQPFKDFLKKLSPLQAPL